MGRLGIIPDGSGHLYIFSLCELSSSNASIDIWEVLVGGMVCLDV